MNSDSQQNSTLLLYGEYFLKVRKTWFIRTVIIALLAVIVSFLIPPKFRSAASIITQNSDNGLSLLGNFEDIASLAGINVSATSPVDLYPAIISSDAVLSAVLRDKFQPLGKEAPETLFDLLGIPEEDSLTRLEDGLKFFRDHVLSLSGDKKSGIVTLEVETGYPDLSAEVANRIVSRLDEFMRFKRRTTASEQLIFIEKRLREVNADLENSEDSLRLFRERNRVTTSSPQLQMEEGRLSRRVDVALSVFVELKKQYELAKIQEIKNSTIVQVLDDARVPARKAWPKRSLIVLMTTFLGSVIVAAHLLWKESLHSDETSPATREFFQRVSRELKNDLAGLFRLIRRRK